MKVKELIKTMSYSNDITEVWVASDEGDVNMYKPHEHNLMIKDFGDREIGYWRIYSFLECDVIELTISVI